MDIPSLELPYMDIPRRQQRNYRGICKQIRQEKNCQETKRGSHSMNQMLLAFCLVLGGASYWLYTENETLKANNAKLEGAIATQEEAIAAMQKDFTLQTEQLQSMTMKSQEIQRELMRYSNFIKEYKLTAKILEDPVEMERKINNGTKHAFEDIEKLSATVDDLDDGLQLQSTIN